MPSPDVSVTERRTTATVMVIFAGEPQVNYNTDDCHITKYNTKERMNIKGVMPEENGFRTAGVYARNSGHLFRCIR